MSISRSRFIDGRCSGPYSIRILYVDKGDRLFLWSDFDRQGLKTDAEGAKKTVRGSFASLQRSAFKNNSSLSCDDRYMPQSARPSRADSFDMASMHSVFIRTRTCSNVSRQRSLVLKDSIRQSLNGFHRRCSRVGQRGSMLGEERSALQGIYAAGMGGGNT